MIPTPPIKPTPPARVSVPAAGADSLYCTVLHRDPEFAELAEAELFAVAGGHSPEPGIWISTVPVRWATCAYTRTGGRQLAFATTLEEFAAKVTSLAIVSPRFRVDAVRVPTRRKGASVARTLVADCIDGDVSESDPLLQVTVVVSALGYRLLVETEADPADATWLRGSRKPHNYLVALPVRIATAMLHITASPGDTVLDPFCGSGTIPLLAAWSGHRAYGSDVSATWIARAGENLAHFGQTAELTCVDARQTDQRADCVVTNLPYGLYSHLAREGLAEVLRNLGRLAPRITLVTSERIEDDLRAEGYEIDRIIAVESDRFERFVYVTRAPASRPPDAR